MGTRRHGGAWHGRRQRPRRGRFALDRGLAAVVTDDDWADYDTGPFCTHWGDEDCDEPCRCGHKCRDHAGLGRDECLVDGCQCDMFEDMP